MKELPKKYNAHEIEKKWQDYWTNNKIFKFDWSDKDKENVYAIDSPPPHVSGALHMGHAFSFSQMDFIARFQRMKGKNVFYTTGYDDNGLPSERYVEKKIKKRSKDMERQEFVKICDKEILDAEDKIREMFKQVGFSFDWDEEYRTISDMSRKVSQMSFIDLYNKGYLYHKEQPVIWDVVDQTALAQTEAEEKEFDSQMTYLKFSIEGGEDLEIMTTRPELLPACVAVFYHPDDEKKYGGKNAITPLGVTVPMIADESVEKDKGTGVMMCCTFGDQADVEKWKKYKLDLRIIFDEVGKVIFDNVKDVISEKYQTELNGLKIKQAREKILEILEAEGKVTRKPVAIKHAVKVGERSKFPVEILVKKQWLIKVLDIKEELHAKAKECKWHPEWMEARIHDWIDGLNWDWCVSRQRFFGVPVPVWYSKRSGEEGKAIMPKVEQLPVDPTCDLPEGYSADEVVRETDVFDTWATSAVSPQLSIHGISEEMNCDKDRYDHLKLPFSLRCQAHDIIRSWAFCTLVKAHCHGDTIPWENLMISGFCLSSDGTKMSKSKGNIIDPVKVLQNHSSDAIRYWAGGSNLGVDTSYSEEIIKTGNKLVTKLFNAAKFAAMNFEKLKSPIANIESDIKDGKIYEVMDLWLLELLSATIYNAKYNFEKYEFAQAKNAIEHFFWNSFCDNYLEIVKVRCYGADGFKYKDTELNEKQKEQITKAQQSAVRTIYYVLNAVLKLFAPFIPHVTEEIFSCVYEDEFEKKKSVHSRGMWPSILCCSEHTLCHPELVSGSILTTGETILKILAEVRQYKSDKNISIKTEMDKITVFCSSVGKMQNVLEDLKNVTNVKEIIFKESNESLKVEFN